MAHSGVTSAGGGVSCVFNYYCDMKECTVSYVKVSITTLYGAAGKLNQSASLPVEQVLFGLEIYCKPCAVREKQGGNRDRSGEG